MSEHAKSTREAGGDFDHPIFRMRLPFAQGDSSASLVQQLGFDEEQQRAVREQLSVDEGDIQEVLAIMGRTALTAQGDRDAWEAANLRAMGISTETVSNGLRGYAQFAGSVDTIAPFINWFIRYTADVSLPPEDMLIISQERRLESGELMGDSTNIDPVAKRPVKGLTLAVGTANQLGIYERSTQFNAAVEGALTSLAQDYGYDTKQLNPRNRKHRLELLQAGDDQPFQTSDGRLLLRMVRERVVAKVEGVEVIKRFDSVLAVRSIASIRKTLRAFAKSPDGRTVNDRELGSEFEQLVDIYELIIRSQGRLPKGDNSAVAPVATSYLMRRMNK